MLRSIAAALPKRQFQLKGQTTKRSSIFSIILLEIIGIGCLAGTYFGMLPDIQRDWTISKDPVPFEEAGISNGQCRVSKVIFKDCKADITFVDSNRRRITRHVELTFFDLHTGSYDTEAVRSASNADMVTLDLSVQTLWNRIALVFLLFVGPGLAMIVGGLYISLAVRRNRMQILALSQARLRPVSVTILKQGRENGYVVTYSCNENGANKKYHAHFIQKTPFLLDPACDDKKALGLTADGVDHVFLVDEELTRLDIDDTERQAIWRARQSISAVRQKPLDAREEVLR